MRLEQRPHTSSDPMGCAARSPCRSRPRSRSRSMPEEILRGKRVLVVEDDYFLAEDMRTDLERAGAEVVGPIPRLKQALDLLARGERLDGTVLDINLAGEMVYPLADALRERGVPFVFATGYEEKNIPSCYADVAWYT